MRKTNIKLKNRNGEDTVYLDVSKILLESETGNKVTFSYGNMVSKTIDLDFSSGNQEIDSPDEELYTHITITKPDQLIPENIADGIEIAGVIGNFEGIMDKPKLRTPSISRVDDLVTITNPATNGSFVESFLIYLNDLLTLEQTTTSFSIASLNYHGPISLVVSVGASGFEESEKSNLITTTTYSISSELEDISTSNIDTLIVEALMYSTILIPNGSTFLPEDINVLMGNQICSYNWNSYTGLLKIENVNGDIEIEASADNSFKLRRPQYKWINNILKISPERFTNYIKLYVNEVEASQIVTQFVYAVEDIPDSTYTFRENGLGYYESNNKGKHSTYAVCKIVFTSQGSREVLFKCINFGESSRDYGLVSQVNQTLSLSITDDGLTGSTKVFRNFKTSNSQTPIELSLPIPDGISFIYIKYRKDAANNVGNDSFQFKIIDN